MHINIEEYLILYYKHSKHGPGSSVGIATDYGLDGPGSNPGGDEIFRPSRPALGPTQPPVNGYRVFPGGKVRPGRAADHSPPSSAAVMEEQSNTSTHPLGHTGPVTGTLYLFYMHLLILSPYLSRLMHGHGLLKKKLCCISQTGAESVYSVL